MKSARAGGGFFVAQGRHLKLTVTLIDSKDARNAGPLLQGFASAGVRIIELGQTARIEVELAARLSTDSQQAAVLVWQLLNGGCEALQGRIWVKNGADKCHVTAREEMQRLFQQSGLLQAGQVPVHGSSADDIDERAFARYFQRRYDQSVEQVGLPLMQLLENIDLAHDSVLNLAGMLLFGEQPQRRLQVCEITAVAFPGTVLYDRQYLDSENIDGPLEEQYRRAMAFIKRNLHHVQGDQGFNTLGQLEVPEGAFEELLVNALIHRGFLVSATIRLFVFADRVEIISPGHLPDVLTSEQIRAGYSNRRNRVLAGHATHILPYRGMGTGIPRALHAWPKIDLIDDRGGNQFRAVVWRPQAVQRPEDMQEPAIGQGTGKYWTSIG